MDDDLREVISDHSCMSESCMTRGDVRIMLRSTKVLFFKDTHHLQQKVLGCLEMEGSHAGSQHSWTLTMETKLATATSIAASILNVIMLKYTPLL